MVCHVCITYAQIYIALESLHFFKSANKSSIKKTSIATAELTELIIVQNKKATTSGLMDDLIRAQPSASRAAPKMELATDASLFQLLHN